MQLANSFTVPVPVEQAWAALLDVERVAPCMPGATLTGFDGDSFAGTVKVKLGPVNLTYHGTGRFVSRDADAHTVVFEASGRDRTASTAAATVTATLVPDGDGTRVDMTTELTITGRPAQFGRGMIADVSGRLIGQFADCLAGQLRGPEPGAAEPAGPPATLEVEPVPAAEPIDLLAVTGLDERLRRVAPYAVGFVAGALVTWLIVRWLR